MEKFIWFQATNSEFLEVLKNTPPKEIYEILGFKSKATCTNYFDQFFPDRPEDVGIASYLTSVLSTKDVIATTQDQLGSDALDEINERLDHIENRLEVPISDKTLLLPPAFFHDMDYKQQYKFLGEFCKTHKIPYDERDPTAKDFHWLFKKIQRQFDTVE